MFWREMEEAGIAAGVLIGRQVPDDTASVSNDDIHDMAVEFPDKIIPFGSLDASRGVSATPKRCWAEIWSEPCFPVPRAARHIGPRFFKSTEPGRDHRLSRPNRAYLHDSLRLLCIFATFHVFYKV